MASKVAAEKPWVPENEGEVTHIRLPSEENKFTADPTPEERTRESKPATKFSPETLDHKCIVKLLIQEGTPVEKIINIIESNPWETTEELAACNSKLLQLVKEMDIPMDWFIRQWELAKSKRSFGQFSRQFLGDK